MSKKFSKKLKPNDAVFLISSFNWKGPYRIEIVSDDGEWAKLASYNVCRTEWMRRCGTWKLKRTIWTLFLIPIWVLCPDEYYKEI